MIDPDKIEIKSRSYATGHGSDVYILSAYYHTELGFVTTQVTRDGGLQITDKMFDIYHNREMDRAYQDLRDYIKWHPEEIKEKIILHQLA